MDPMKRLSMSSMSRGSQDKARKEKRKKDDIEVAKIRERHKKGSFGQQSLLNLRNRLADEITKEEEEKCACLCTSLSEEGPMNWLMVKVNQSSSKEALSMELQLEELRHLNYFGCTVWNSCKIIIAGGVGKDGPSDKVFIYDILSKTWDPPSRMNHKRPENPVLVVADNKLFVFGGRPVYEYPYTDLNAFEMEDVGELPLRINRRDLAASKKLFAEFCNLDHHTAWLWDYLPCSHRYPAGRWPYPWIRTHAVYSKKCLILFWVESSGCVYSFDYNNGTWEKFESYRPINPLPHWSDTVVVLEDFLFWHYQGTIYAHDLLEDLTFPMHTLSRTDIFGPTDSGSGVALLPTFLVHVGKGTLCLICGVDEDAIWYCTFLVQVSLSRGPAMLKILPGASGFLSASVPIGHIIHALECSSA